MRKGGKFLFLPPGYKGDVPEGYFVYWSGTNNVFVFLRSFYQDPKNLKPAVDLVKQAKIYPLKGEAKPMKFPDASGVPVNMLPTSDSTAFDQLKLLLDREGTDLGDPDWLGTLGHRHREGPAVQPRPAHPGHPRSRPRRPGTRRAG